MKSSTIKLFIILFLVSCFLSFLDKRGVLDFAKTPIQTITNPIYASVYSTKDVFGFLTFWKSGEMRIKNLEERNLELMSFKAEAERLRGENITLREQFSVSVVKKGQLIVAQVLGSDRYMEIDAGKIGQNVVYKDNLIGRIVRVSSKVSYVQKTSDPSEKIPVKVGLASGIALGQFNSSIILDKISANEQIKEGDLVITSGEGGTFVPNLIVGKVSKIFPSPGDIFQKAEIVPLYDEKHLNNVFVIND